MLCACLILLFGCRGSPLAGSSAAEPCEATNAANGGDVDAFVAALRDASGTFDYEPSDSPAALAAVSDIVIRACLNRVEAGPSYAPAAGAPTVWGTSILHVNVERVVAGDESFVFDGKVYVEIPAPRKGGDAGTTLPVGLPVLLFLSDRTDSYSEFVTDEAAGRPEGASVTAPHVQGFLLEAASELVSVYDELTTMAPAWQRLDTLEEAEQQTLSSPSQRSTWRLPGRRERGAGGAARNDADEHIARELASRGGRLGGARTMRHAGATPRRGWGVAGVGEFLEGQRLGGLGAGVLLG